MEIQKLQALTGRSPKVKALGRLLADEGLREIRLGGLVASSAPMFCSALAEKCPEVLACPYLFIMDDEEQAGYFYHDMTQILGTSQVYFMPSSFRRAVKYGQRDAGNEILRTNALSALTNEKRKSASKQEQSNLFELPSGSRFDGVKTENGNLDERKTEPLTAHRSSAHLFVVTYPEALTELVVSKQDLQDHTIGLAVGETRDIRELQKGLMEQGFRRTDYVYEPGQFAVRGSLVHVYSFSHEHPFRLDFFPH